MRSARHFACGLRQTLALGLPALTRSERIKLNTRVSLRLHDPNYDLPNRPAFHFEAFCMEQNHVVSINSLRLGDLARGGCCSHHSRQD